MSHHSNEINEDLKRLLGLGATGEYPDGQLNLADEGEIKIAIAADRKAAIIRIEFGKPVAFVGLRPEEAQGIIDILQAKVWELRGIL